MNLELPSAVLLIVALLAALGSTKQTALWRRALVWGAGAICLVSAIAIVAGNGGHAGLFRAVRDLGDNVPDLGKSVLGQAIARNGPGVLGFILPALDLFLVIGGLLLIFALLAFTRGERLEKLVRPLTIGLIGAMVGASAALAIVGMGFGDVRKQRVYSTLVGQDARRDVYDGDSLWIGEVSLRLFGADTPELNQICFDAEGRENPNCGEMAEQEFERIVADRLVICEVIERRGRVDDSFGRPLAKCWAEPRQRAGVPVNPYPNRVDDIAELLLNTGFAVDYESPTVTRRRSAAEATGAGEGRNLLAGCMLRPKLWRRNRHAREQFLARDLAGLVASHDVIGAACGQIHSESPPAGEAADGP